MLPDAFQICQVHCQVHCPGCRSDLALQLGNTNSHYSSPDLFRLLLVENPNPEIPTNPSPSQCIAAGAPQLTYLALQRCAGLSDAGLAALAPLTRLETLIITGGDATFSKVGIAAAFRRPALPELRFLDLMPPAVPVSCTWRHIL